MQLVFKVGDLYCSIDGNYIEQIIKLTSIADVSGTIADKSILGLYNHNGSFINVVNTVTALGINPSDKVEEFMWSIREKTKEWFEDYCKGVKHDLNPIHTPLGKTLQVYQPKKHSTQVHRNKCIAIYNDIFDIIGNTNDIEKVKSLVENKLMPELDLFIASINSDDKKMYVIIEAKAKRVCLVVDEVENLHYDYKQVELPRKASEFSRSLICFGDETAIELDADLLIRLYGS